MSHSIDAGRTFLSKPQQSVVVENLTKRFGRFTAVDGISFNVSRGEIFGFLGPNGAGKSTTIRMLCGILLPTSGRGSIAGFDVISQSEKIKSRIGYMSQRFSLYEDLTAAENIEFYGGIYGVSNDRLRQRKEWILDMAGLTERADSLAGYLSAGWKQRLALGCALVHEPEILFLDEPTSGVDPVSRRNFWELIYTVSGEGVTVFVTTHYMDEAEHCNRLGLIYAGRLIALGSPRELSERYKAGIVLEICAEPAMKALEIVLEMPQVKDAGVFGSAIHAVVETENEADTIRRLLDASGVDVLMVEAIVPSLEDAFIALIETASGGVGE